MTQSLTYVKSAAPRYRHEYKYRIDAMQEAILRIRAGAVLQLDSHVGPSGGYTIRSLYFDDRNDTCLRENASGTEPRSKFRIRYYNRDLSWIVLEKKSKIHGMCTKESCPITQEECLEFMQGRIPELDEGASDTRKRLFAEFRIRALQPKVIVTYDRIPFVYPGGNVRVTFDRNVTSSFEIERFLSGQYSQRPIFPMGECVMEVKWDEVMPLHIKQVLQVENLTWTAFSKYYMCRLHHL